ncbi:MAG: hypothetical protein ACREA7_09555 [Nitrosotalea sp.]
MQRHLNSHKLEPKDWKGIEITYYVTFIWIYYSRTKLVHTLACIESIIVTMFGG